MKRIGRFQKFVHSSSDYIYGVCTIAFSGLQTLGGVDTVAPKGYLAGKPRLIGTIQIFQDFIFPLSILIGVVAVVCFVVKRKSNPWVLDKIQFILDECKHKCFEQIRNEPEDHHRVTLFRLEYCTFRRHWSSASYWKPWGKNPIVSRYLVPWLRSGDLSKNSSALFYVCDNSANSEGLSGMAWSTKSSIFRGNLPDLSQLNKVKKRKSTELIETYAAETNCSVDMVKKLCPLTRSIAVMPVMVKGKIWGVVVMDSRKPDGVTHAAVQEFELTVAIVGQLLEIA